MFPNDSAGMLTLMPVGWLTPDDNSSSASTARKQGYTALNLKETTPDDRRDGITKVDVLEWLRRCTEADACWVLKELKLIRPSVVMTSEDQDDDPLIPRRDASRVTVHSSEPLGLGEMTPGVSVIQFSTALSFCNSDEQSSVTLDIIRIGDMSMKSDVAYATKNGSAIHGEDYEATSGLVTFQPGEATQQIRINLLNNGRWNTTTEFKLGLKEATNATLGLYLFETRVKIIDSSPFPTDAMYHLELNTVRPSRVLREFFIMTWLNPPVRRGTLWCMLIDLIHNVWYFAGLFMTVYLLDYIIHRDRPVEELLFIQDRELSLIAYSSTTIVVLGLLHVLDYSKFDTKIGQARTFVQTAIVRKFMNYSCQSMQQVTAGDITMAIQRDAVDVVAEGYMSCLALVMEVEKLLFMLTFKLMSPSIFGGKVDTAALVPLLIFPVLLGPFLLIRGKPIAATLTDANEAQEELTDSITEVTTNHSLLVDFAMRGWAADFVGERLVALNKASKAASQVLFNTNYFAKWVTALVVGGFVVYGGKEVIRGDLSLGMFVTDLEIIKASGQAFSAIYSLLVDMQRIHPSMMGITRLLNLPTDVSDRMTLKQSEVKLSSKMRRQILSEQPGVIAVDLLPIVLNLDDDFPFEGTSTSLNFDGKHNISQGQMVSILGGSGAGKRTLLRLVSGRMLPESLQGDNGVFVPSHLRIVCVSDAPVFYSGTLYENLIFAMNKDRPEASRDRVVRLCKQLGVHDNILTYMDRTPDWEAIFSEAQRKLVNIARALINNAEVICLDKPLAKFDQAQGAIVSKALLEHVAKKGLCMQSDGAMRRPRTVFLSSSLPIPHAHSQYLVSRKDGISLVTHEKAMEILEIDIEFERTF